MAVALLELLEQAVQVVVVMGQSVEMVLLAMPTRAVAVAALVETV